jgi:hypothetical protein
MFKHYHLIHLKAEKQGARGILRQLIISQIDLRKLDLSPIMKTISIHLFSETEEMNKLRALI